MVGVHGMTITKWIHQLNPQRCWEYFGELDQEGYGIYENEYAHKLMYAETYRKPIDTLDKISHTCDNKRCCNPWHLVEGVVTKQVHEQAQKGSLSVKQQQDILNDTRSANYLAGIYKCHPQTIRRVRRLAVTKVDAKQN